MEAGLQNFLLYFLKSISERFWSLFHKKFCNSLPGISVFINGFTYSYAEKGSKNGEKCCRPVKSKCHLEKCQISRGEIKCGEGCGRVIKALLKLQRKEEKKKRKEKTKKNRDYAENGSFEEYSHESISESESSEEKGGVTGGGGGEVKKLSQKQLQMMETTAEEKKKSQNPLCKVAQLFRCVKLIMPKTSKT